MCSCVFVRVCMPRYAFVSACARARVCIYMRRTERRQERVTQGQRKIKIERKNVCVCVCEKEGESEKEAGRDRDMARGKERT